MVAVQTIQKETDFFSFRIYGLWTIPHTKHAAARDVPCAVHRHHQTYFEHSLPCIVKPCETLYCVSPIFEMLAFLSWADEDISLQFQRWQRVRYCMCMLVSKQFIFNSSGYDRLKKLVIIILKLCVKH